MTDVEKVVNALKNCVRDGICINCEYEKHVACKTCLMADALELMKEQKAIIEQYHKADRESLW